MSQAELARRIGISKTSMNEIERGDTLDPRFSVVEAIAHTLGLSLDAFARTTKAVSSSRRRSAKEIAALMASEEAP
jgi:transcriptional regulator with XRE-family HTH domain